MAEHTKLSNDVYLNTIKYLIRVRGAMTLHRPIPRSAYATTKVISQGKNSAVHRQAQLANIARPRLQKLSRDCRVPLQLP